MENIGKISPVAQARAVFKNIDGKIYTTIANAAPETPSLLPALVVETKPAQKGGVLIENMACQVRR